MGLRLSLAGLALGLLLVGVGFWQPALAEECSAYPVVTAPVTLLEAFTTEPDARAVQTQAAFLLVVANLLRSPTRAECIKQPHRDMAPPEDLAVLGVPSTIYVLETAWRKRYPLRELQEELRRRGFAGAGGMGVRSDPRLAAELRALTAELLAEPERRAAALLAVHSLQHPDPLVRVAAATATAEVVKHGEELAVQHLRSNVRERDPLVRLVAATRLARLAPRDPFLKQLAAASPRPSGSDPILTSTIVHGASADPGDWRQPQENLHGHLLGDVAPDLYAGDQFLDWTGAWTNSAWRKDAKVLAAWAEAHKSPGLTLVAHGHGANLAMLATRRGLEIGRLVLLSCPVHWTKYQPKPGSIKSALSIRTRLDLGILAGAGGQRFPRGSGISEYILPVWFNSVSHDPEVSKARHLQQELPPRGVCFDVNVVEDGVAGRSELIYPSSAGDATPAEHLLFDNVCFRPRACAEATASVLRQIGGHLGTPEYPCPNDCITIIREAGEHKRCTGEVAGNPRAPVVEYIKGTGDPARCDPGVALDIEERHRLFVHGLHSNREAWNYWYDRVKQQMDFKDKRTVRDNTGRSAFYGDGTMPLLSQVAELASQINVGFAGFPNGPVDVYAHSLGALKIEALLQLGYDRGPGDPWFQAARKIARVYIFQGAHGGCLATSWYANGDRPNHGTGPGCPASLDIGRVNDFPSLIPGSVTSWDMNKIVWGGQKRIYYVVATSNGGKIDGKVVHCDGAAGFICDDTEDHDGVVYESQMVPSWYKNFEVAKAAGYVSVIKAPFHYCHMSGDKYEPPRLSTRLMNQYVGIKDVRYRVAKWHTFTLERAVTSCDERCFCTEDQVGACQNRLDCSRYSPDLPNCIPPGGDWHGDNGKPVGPEMDQLPKGLEPTYTPGHEPVPDYGYDVQTTNLRELASWSHCAVEGAVCAFSGTRQVRYGAAGTYTTRTITDGTPCNNEVFGDPVPGVAKSCEVWVP
ncbi:MAG TPA: HEAT repeat domain-containing protein [Thermoanaerobaculia bacterium]|nr:HEAT repeat domain-containing protein [Thermoanaerobaculia bacterium]